VLLGYWWTLVLYQHGGYTVVWWDRAHKVSDANPTPTGKSGES